MLATWMSNGYKKTWDGGLLSLVTDSGLECIVNGTNAHPSKSRHVSYWSLTLSAKPLPMFFSIPKNVLPLSTYSLPVSFWSQPNSRCSSETTSGSSTSFPFYSGTSGKEPACQHGRQETWAWPLGQDDPLEKAWTTHSRILAWRIPWMEESGGLQSMYRVGHDWNNLAHVMVWARKHFLKILNWETNMCYVPLISSYFSSPHNNIFSTFIHCFILHLTFSYLCPFPLDYKFFKANQVQYEILGWSKHSFWFFCNILRKKPNSFCCQPNISLYYVTRLRDEKGRKRRKIAVRESLYDVR